MLTSPSSRLAHKTAYLRMIRARGRLLERLTDALSAWWPAASRVVLKIDHIDMPDGGRVHHSWSVTSTRVHDHLPILNRSHHMTITVLNVPTNIPMGRLMRRVEVALDCRLTDAILYLEDGGFYAFDWDKIKHDQGFYDAQK